MCFVEFEDVGFATKALNDLYGNTLNGLVKGGGIRLSYSKNPLGVRTPTSAGNASFHNQQLQTSNTTSFSPEPFRSPSDVEPSRPPGIHRPPIPPGLSQSYMMSPPPRFFSPPSPSSTAFINPLSSMPRPNHPIYCPPPNGVSTFSPFGLSTPSPPQLPIVSDQASAEAPDHQFSHHPLSPSVEAAKAS